jgi:transcriptional regulator with XRE-family HTH domain
MTRSETIVRGGAKLRGIRVRLGLSVRDVERLSIELAENRHNPYLAFSKTWITDIEKGRFVPGSFKMASLAEIYGMDLVEIHKLYGVPPGGDITKERPVFRPPKTHLLTPGEPPSEGDAVSADSTADMRAEETSLLVGMVDIWGSVPVPLLRRFRLRQSLFGYIGTEDMSMVPLLPPGSFVQIDAKQNRIQKGPFKKSSSESHFARPIYFLDIRTGYACGWCQLKDGVLTLVPHPNSGVETRTFRYPSEVSVVGRVTAVTMSIEEERFVPLEEAKKGPTNPKK